jgi:hypothetical protein
VGVQMVEPVERTVETILGMRGREADLWKPALAQLPVDGLSIATLAHFLGTETVSASDDVASRIDEMQFDLSEGPCWDAMRAQRPVYEPNVREPSLNRWPELAEAIGSEPVRALFAFPLVFGSLGLGAMDLYVQRPGPIDPAAATSAALLADAIAKIVLARALASSDGADSQLVEGQYSRRVVHQATGFVIAQLGLSPEDAQLLVHAYAFAAGRPVADVAADVVERRLKFDSGTGTIRSGDE